MEAAVEPLDQQRAHDEGELLGDAVGVLVFAFLGRLEEADGAVTVVGQAVRVGQERDRAVVQVFKRGRQWIVYGAGLFDMRKGDALLGQVLAVLVVLLQVGAGAPDDDFRNDLGADEFVSLLDLAPGRFDVGFLAGLPVLFFALGEKVL